MVPYYIGFCRLCSWACLLSSSCLWCWEAEHPRLRQTLQKAGEDMCLRFEQVTWAIGRVVCMWEVAVRDGLLAGRQSCGCSMTVAGVRLDGKEADCWGPSTQGDHKGVWVRAHHFGGGQSCMCWVRVSLLAGIRAEAILFFIFTNTSQAGHKCTMKEKDKRFSLSKSPIRSKKTNL